MPTLTRAQAGKAVSVNWLFLDQTRQLKLCCVNIPHPLFTDCVQNCRGLFVEQLDLEHGFKAKIHSITFFEVLPHSSFSSHLSYALQPKEPTFIKLGWKETFADRTILDNLNEIDLPLKLCNVLEGKLDELRIHLLVTAEESVETEAAHARGEADDVITELGLPEVKREFPVVISCSIFIYLFQALFKHSKDRRDLHRLQPNPQHMLIIRNTLIPLFMMVAMRRQRALLPWRHLFRYFIRFSTTSCVALPTLSSHPHRTKLETRTNSW